MLTGLSNRSLWARGGSSSVLVPFDEQNQRYFSRVWAGVAWPGDHPGWVVVIGQEYNPKDCRYFLLTEFSSHDLAEMLDKCLTLQTSFKIDAFIAAPDEQTFFFLNHFNQERRAQGLKEFHFQEPPNFMPGGKINYNLNVLKSTLVPSRTRLDLGDESALPKILENLPAGAPELTTGQAPAATALSFVICALETYPFQYDGGRTQAQRPYNPLEYR